MSITPKSLAGINALFGLWLIAIPFVFEAPTSDQWNDVVVGTVIVLLAGYNYYRAANQQPMSTGGAGLNVLLGVWLIIAPFIFGVTGALLWNDIIVGTLVASFAGYNTYVASSGEQRQPTPDQTME